MFDARYATVSEQRSVAEKLAVKAWGPYWQVDRTKGAPFVALQYQETQPNLMARYFITGSDLIRTISTEPDPWQTWEWADLLGLATTEPTGSPNSPEQARIAYNLARSKGDETQAQEYRKQVERLIEPRKISYSNDLHLIGLKVDRGAATVVTILWETGTNFIPFDGEYLVRSKVIAAPWFWTSAIDYFEKEMAPPMTHKPALWKPGRIYSQSFIAMKRPGKEKFEGIWSPKGGATVPKLPKGKDRVELWIGD